MPYSYKNKWIIYKDQNKSHEHNIKQKKQNNAQSIFPLYEIKKKRQQVYLSCNFKIQANNCLWGVCCSHKETQVGKTIFVLALDFADAPWIRFVRFHWAGHVCLSILIVIDVL